MAINYDVNADYDDSIPIDFIDNPAPASDYTSEEEKTSIDDLPFLNGAVADPTNSEYQDFQESLSIIDNDLPDPTNSEYQDFQEPDYSTMPDDNERPPLSDNEPANNPVIDLKNPKEAESFATSLCETLVDCTNELEAINAVVDAVISSKAKGFDKTIAGYLSSQITDNVKGLKGKKTAINKGVIDAVKIAKAKQSKEQH